MAGILKVDTLQSDSNLALKIATANVAFIDSNGLNVVGGNLTIGATQFAEGGQVQTAGIADGAVTNAKIVSVANTKISGNIVSSQIAPEQTFYGNTVISGTGSFLRLASGTGGIQFGGDTSAANALDDYEEGTFTPAFTPNSGSVTYSEQSGFYVKIGRFVQCNIALYLSGLSSPSGSVVITGMPFASGGGERFVCAWNIGLARDFASALTLTGYIGTSSTTLQISKNLANASFSALQGSDLNSNTGFYISIGYFTA